MRIITAFRVFFSVLWSKKTAERLKAALIEQEPPPAVLALEEPKPVVPVVQKIKKRASAQSEAITLLATLQREARFVDFFQETLADYSDAQIGAAARSVHADTQKTLKRCFDIIPLLDQEEETPITIDTANPARYQFSGKTEPKPPYKGVLQHAGWQAAYCQLPNWEGDEKDSLIIAPAEIEI